MVEHVGEITSTKARFVLRGFCSVVPYSVVKKKGNMNWFGGVALCSVATIKVLLKVLGKTFVIVLLYHSSDRGWF